jgi:hypothetical protein
MANHWLGVGGPVADSQFNLFLSIEGPGPNGLAVTARSALFIRGAPVSLILILAQCHDRRAHYRGGRARSRDGACEPGVRRMHRAIPKALPLM